MWGNKAANGTTPAYESLKHFMPSIIWAAFVLWLSLSPQRGFPRWDLPHLDKIVHFICYFILAALMYFGRVRKSTASFRPLPVIITLFLIALVYGLSIEVLQEALTADRHFSWLDETANAAGAFTGLVVMQLLGRRAISF